MHRLLTGARATSARLVAALVAVALVTLAGPAVSARASAGGSTLLPGEQLSAGEQLVSPNGSYRLVEQADGNAVVYGPAQRVLWSSHTYGSNGARLVFQPDGNLVVYSAAGRALWHAGTWGNTGGRVALQDDGNLVTYRADGTATWYSGWDRTGLRSGEQLLAGQQITSPDGRYWLTLQSDGNLVTYAGSRPIFYTGSWGSSRLTLQADGNLVVYRPNGTAGWSSGTWREGPSRLEVQNDGNVVLYRSDGTVSWYSGWDRGQWASAPSNGTASYRSLPLRTNAGTSTQVVTVAAPSAGSTTAQLTAWQRTANGWTAVLGPVPARIGSAGVGQASETTSRTPAGTFTLTEGFGRAGNPGTALPYRVIDGNDWWVSDVNSARYNQYARCAPRTCDFDEAAGENLYAQGAVYDYALVIDYNRVGTIRGAGSAFFLHVTNGAATAGCVAIDPANLTALMRWLQPAAVPLISIGVG